MLRWVPVAVGLGALAGVGPFQLQAERAPLAAQWAAQSRLSYSQSSAAAAEDAASTSRALLDKYCVTCHNERTRTADLTLDKMDVSRVGEGSVTWEKVVRKLRAHAMPPAGRLRPDEAASKTFVSWLETELDHAAMAKPDPGRPAIHRLNRVEYANAIRDLFGLDVDAHTLLPADDEQNGFDNIADVLSVSPTLIERYMVAAQRISQLAVGDPGLRPIVEAYPVSGALNQDERTSDDMPFASRGGVAIHHNFPIDGEYLVRVKLRKQEYGYVRGLGQPHQMEVRLDGARIGTFTVGRVWQSGQLPAMGYAGKFDGKFDYGSQAWEDYALHADEELSARTSVKGGSHLVAVSFDRRSTLREGILPLPTDRSSYSYGQDEQQDADPAVSTVEIVGPFSAVVSNDLPSRRKLFVCSPTGGPAGEEHCAIMILSALARRAYRRPTTPADIQPLLTFYRAGRGEGDFNAGIQAAVERILVDPEFLFRVESDPPGVPPGTAYRISDLELASRLSFFLWSSVPDDELLDLAARGKLRDPAVLDRQIQRMLADSRSKALIENFAGQWLKLRNLRNAAPDTATYVAFDENLRDAMRQETELFLENELRENQPVVNVLRANYTFVNERLAQHYGIPDVYGVQFRRVTYPDDTRGGLLGHASILTVTSYANRTSPVVRGKWLLENVLGTPPSPPPPNVPSLPNAREDGTPRSVRERLEMHRKNAVCASCHNTIDPLGFALENYDAIGRWRTTNDGGTPFDTGVPIDASGSLMDGTKVQGLVGLRNVMLSRSDQFVETVTEKLLTYALGRSLEYYDMPVVRQIGRQSAASELRWSSLISSIVKSTPFLMRRSES